MELCRKGDGQCLAVSGRDLAWSLWFHCLWNFFIQFSFLGWNRSVQMNAVSPASPTRMEAYVRTKSCIRCYNNIKNVDMGSSARGTCSPMDPVISIGNHRGSRTGMREGKGSERQKEQGSFPPQPLLRGCPTASSSEAQPCSRIDPVKPHLHPRAPCPCCRVHAG